MLQGFKQPRPQTFTHVRSFRARASAVWRKSSDLLSVKDTPGFRHAYYVAGIFALGCEGIISEYCVLA